MLVFLLHLLFSECKYIRKTHLFVSSEVQSNSIDYWATRQTITARSVWKIQHKYAHGDNVIFSALKNSIHPFLSIRPLLHSIASIFSWFNFGIVWPGLLAAEYFSLNKFSISSSWYFFEAYFQSLYSLQVFCFKSQLSTM